MRRLFHAATSMPHIDTQTRLSPEAMDDIHWWAACCEDRNCKALFVNSKWTSSEDVKLWTDASGQGFGIAFDREWSYGTWCPDEELQSIERKDLSPIVLALAMWGSHLSGQRLRVRCDNKTVCAVWKSGTTKAKPLMGLLRVGLLIAAWYNVVVSLVPISGVDNSVADSLSRLQVQKFKQLHPTAAPMPREPRRYVIRELMNRHGTIYAQAWRQVRKRLTQPVDTNTSSLP